MDISCIVLAGGRALRLGRNKLLVDIGGKSLIQRVIDALIFFQSDIIVVTGRHQFLPEVACCPGTKIVPDLYPDAGPLGGVYTGITAADSFYNLVVASDMPFLSRPLLAHMLKNVPGFDVVVPRLGENRLEPLHAVYSKGCLPYIRHHLETGDRNIISFFPDVRVRYLERAEIDRFDPEHLSFFNINTEADLTMARELVKTVGQNDPNP
ncbi:MAG: molybdenum cofactor guanylyltransferase [Chloroflexota bacterium]